MKKRLVYHWFIPNNITDDIRKYMQLHKNCLRNYVNVFDEAVFMFARDTEVSDEVLTEHINEIIRLGFKQFRYFVKDNDELREANTFMTLCVDKLEENRDDVTFFFHNKGLTHEFSDTIVDWNAALYYFNLEYADEIIDALTKDDDKFTSGIMLTKNNRFSCKYHWVYSGAAHWMNNGKVLKYIKDNNIGLGYEERRSAEEFFGSIFDMDHAHSIGGIFEDSWGDYRDCLNYHIRAIVDEESVNKLIEFRDKIALKGINDNAKKYSIYTFNIGGYEVLHEIENPSPNCEYIYVTDDKTLTSSTWTVVYVENEHPEDNFKLCWDIRYNPFKYCSTDVVIRIDGTTQPFGNTDIIYDEFINGGYDIGLFLHPSRQTMVEEYAVWEEHRKYPREQSVKALSFMLNEGYDIVNYKGMYQLNFIIHKRNKVNEDILMMTHALCRYLAPEGKIVDRLDQTIMSFVINKYFKDLKVLPIDDTVLNGSFFKMYWHGSTKQIPVDITTTPKYLFNKEVKPCTFGVPQKRYKKMFYYLWVSPDFEENIAVQVHKMCLEEIVDKFDELNFIVATDDYPNSDGDFLRAIKWLDSICKGRDYNVRMCDNSKLRESRVILEDLMPLVNSGEDSYVFLGHSKGITDVNMKERNIYSVLRWVIAMYFYSMSYIPEMEEKLINSAMFGPLLTHWNHENDANIDSHGMFYIGNFYWVNPKNIKIRSDDEFERLSKSRFLHENFPLLLDINSLSSHNNIYTENYVANLYHMESGEWMNYLSLYGDEELAFDAQNRILSRLPKKEEKDTEIFVFAHKDFDTERTNPAYTIVCSDKEDVKSDKLNVRKVNTSLANDGWLEWAKIYELCKEPYKLKKYVGMNHYHRYFKFSDDVNFIPNIEEEFKDNWMLAANIVPIGNLRSQYGVCHNSDDFEIAVNCIRELYPEFLNDETILDINLLFASNMVIMEKYDFLEMCDFIFKVLFRYCEVVGIDPTNNEDFHKRVNDNIEKYAKKHYQDDDEYSAQSRIPAYLAERLLTMWIIKKADERREKKIKTYPLIEK